MFRLHLQKLLEVDVADPLMPQVDARPDRLPFCEHCNDYIIGFKDENSSIPTPLRDDPAVLLDEVPVMSE